MAGISKAESARKSVVGFKGGDLTRAFKKAEAAKAKKAKKKAPKKESRAKPSKPKAQTKPKGELVKFTPIDNLDLTVEGFKLGVNGLQGVVGKPDLSACDRFAKRTRTLTESIQFNVGGFANWLDSTYGEESSQVLDQENFFSRRTLEVWRWVERSVPPHVRRIDRGVSFAHHQTVGGLPVPRQDYWLQRCEDEGLTVKALKDALKVEEPGWDKSVDEPEEKTEWALEVILTSEKQRESLATELESEGYTVKRR